MQYRPLVKTASAQKHVESFLTGEIVMKSLPHMNRMTKLSLRIAALVVGANAAHAVQPPDPVSSDSYDNTAAGSYALAGETTGALNTAIGFETLYNNTTGQLNTALGGSALFGTTTGTNNVGAGAYALHLNSTGNANTASGSYAMYFNTAGGLNTATGASALRSNATGDENTASGASSLYSNTTGYNNTATGSASLYSNTFGSNNDASGAYSLTSNTAGSFNVASGAYSLYGNITGSNNVAAGEYSLYTNTTGGSNVAVGPYAMLANTVGDLNVGIGSEALQSNTSGKGNTAIGPNALSLNTVGSHNIAVGNYAGVEVTGSNNIDIGAEGTQSDNGAIRIGTPKTQTKAYIAGISTTHLTGAAVYVDSSGQLGVLASSERYKTAIEAMDRYTDKLQSLRPVTLHLKNDPHGAVQFGLIAEEVDMVYPELVIRDDAGHVQGVRYDELAPMLLNEMQKEKAQLHDLQAQIAALKQSNEVLKVAVREMMQKDQRVAMR